MSAYRQQFRERFTKRDEDRKALEIPEVLEFLDYVADTEWKEGYEAGKRDTHKTEAAKTQMIIETIPDTLETTEFRTELLEKLGE